MTCRWSRRTTGTAQAKKCHGTRTVVFRPCFEQHDALPGKTARSCDWAAPFLTGDAMLPPQTLFCGKRPASRPTPLTRLDAQASGLDASRCGGMYAKLDREPQTVNFSASTRDSMKQILMVVFAPALPFPAPPGKIRGKPHFPAGADGGSRRIPRP